MRPERRELRAYQAHLDPYNHPDLGVHLVNDSPAQTKLALQLRSTKQGSACAKEALQRILGVAISKLSQFNQQRLVGSYGHGGRTTFPLFPPL